MKFLDWPTGKKTYITVAIGLSIGVYQGLTGHTIPEWVYVLLGFAGLGFQRMAVTGQTQIATQAVEVLLQSVLSQISTPDTPTSAVAPGQTVTVSGQPVVIGKPTPKDLDEKSVTDALNSAQLKQ